MTADALATALHGRGSRSSALDAECIIVGAIALNPTGFARATEALDPTDCADPLCRAVFAIGKSVRERWGDVPDVETVIWILDDFGMLKALGGEKAIYALLNDFVDNTLIDWAIELVKSASEARRIATFARDKGDGQPGLPGQRGAQQRRRKTPRDSLMRV